MNVPHITIQHPHPLSFFGCSWAETTGGFQLGLGVSPSGGVFCTLGIVLYPVLVFGRGTGSGSGSGSGVLLFSSTGGSTALGGTGGMSLGWTARGAKSRSYVVGVRPSFSHCSCCSFFATVGSICWSGGRRGSGLYIVASHGGSPSGRLAAVVGRLSPDRVVGLCKALPETARDLAVEVFLFVGGADVFRVADPAFAGVFLAGVFGVVLKPRLPGRLPGEGVEWFTSPKGSLALRPRLSSSSYSSVAARLRAPRESRESRPGMIGTGLAVEIGIREELFRRPGWL